MNVYYNEYDKKKCAMLKALMDDGHISKGDIDDRSIRDVQPADLDGYDRCHFFAGVGLWDHALNLAAWNEDLPVWTGSCPCQPYSTAGRQKAQADDRHLWPEWLRLIEQCRPPTIFGEQVANAVTHGWLDDVFEGLEAEDYAVGAAVLPACSVGAPHRRDRLWFVADNTGAGFQDGRGTSLAQPGQKPEFERCGGSIMGYTQHNGSPAKQKLRSHETASHERSAEEQEWPRQSSGTSRSPDVRSVQGSESGSQSIIVADAERVRPQGQGQLQRPMHPTESGEGQASEFDDDCSRHWQNGQWIDCPDNKQRLVEPGIPLLAHGYPERVAIIHAAGDAIVPQVAAAFILAYRQPD